MVDVVTLVTISSVVIVFLIFLTIIWKLEGNANIYKERKSEIYKDRRKMASVSPVNIPFSLDIHDSQQTTNAATDSISVFLKGANKCCITFYACVAIKELQKSVAEKKFSKEKKLVDVLNLISLWSSVPESVCFPESGVIHHKFSYKSLPSEVAKNLLDLINEPKGHCIPFLIHVELDPVECSNLVADDNVVSLLSAASVSRGNSRVKFKITEQYMQILDGRVFLLKKLYPSCIDDDKESADQLNPVEFGDLCVVCQEYPVTRALLPCRHLCTCKTCFSRLDDCPICRQNITSYFTVRDESDIPASHEEDKEDDISSLIQYEGIWSFIKSIWNAS